MCVSIALKRLTSFRIGGEAQVAFIERKSDASILLDEPYVLGFGTNVLASEKISRPVAAIRLGGYDFSGDRVTVGSGVALARLAREAAARGLHGLEWAIGVPASVGGAVKMNAGAFGGEMSDVIESVTTYSGGKILTLSANECGFAYRSSSFYGVVLEVQLRLKKSDGAEIERKMREYARLRREKQPIGASAGSVYKRASLPAAMYIDRAGLKGERVGDAVVSLKHANFIINEGSATAYDVLALMERIEKRVYELFGVRLEREIELLGDF